MKWETWESLAKRQAWYKQRLLEITREWPEERVDSCNDIGTLRWLAKLSDRVERHQKRMDRHMAKALASLPPQGATKQ